MKYIKFLLDECVGASVAKWLKENGYDVFDIAATTPGISDAEVLEIALAQDRIYCEFQNRFLKIK